MNKHSNFYNYVQNYVEENPECGAYVSDYVARGLETARLQANLRAADMEAALCFALNKKLKNSDEFILTKLEKWQSKAALNWGSVIDALKSKSSKQV